MIWEISLLSRLLRQQFFLFCAAGFVSFAEDSAAEAARDAPAAVAAVWDLMWKRAGILHTEHLYRAHGMTGWVKIKGHIYVSFFYFYLFEKCGICYTKK